jgi:hypothetical protein
MMYSPSLKSRMNRFCKIFCLSLRGSICTMGTVLTSSKLRKESHLSKCSGERTATFTAIFASFGTRTVAPRFCC